MIDYINIRTKEVKSFKHNILASGLINTLSPFDNKSREILDKISGNYNNLFINSTKNYGEVKNSLHTFFNSKTKQSSSNFDDFNFTELCFSIDYLESIINMDLSNFTLSGLEIGLNIEIDRCPTEIINRFIHLYDFKSFNFRKSYGGKYSYYSHRMTDYSLKIYDKSHQFKLNKHILRFEIKFLSSRKLKIFGISNLHDLKDKSKLKLLFEFLLGCFDKLLILDNITHFDDLKKKDSKFLLDGRTEIFWKEMLENKSTSTVRDRKKLYQKIINENNLNTIQLEIRNRLISKFERLLNPI